MDKNTYYKTVKNMAIEKVLNQYSSDPSRPALKKLLSFFKKLISLDILKPLTLILCCILEYSEYSLIFISPKYVSLLSHKYKILTIPKFIFDAPIRCH